MFNKQKPIDRKDKIILINASELYKPLKKSKGKKRREMDPDNRTTIVQILTDFTNNDFARVFPKWQFYYNRQAIMLTNVHENGLSFEDQLPVKTNVLGEAIRAKSKKLSPTRLVQIDENGELVEFTTFSISAFDAPRS